MNGRAASNDHRPCPAPVSVLSNNTRPGWPARRFATVRNEGPAGIASVIITRLFNTLT
jgi:hypothetical protein